MSLISKITEKLKNPTNGKILSKGVASLALASALALSGCSGLASIFNPNNGQTNNPNIDNDNQTQIGGDGSATTPEEDLSGFSQITYNLLENSYYRNLLNSYDADYADTGSQLYDPIPYGFLQSEGYNIERIKNDELECDSMPYIKDGEENSLYIALRVETNAQIPYYTCYTIKYPLTNLEKSDLDFIHNERAFEAPLFIQELSYQKTPVVESEASMTIECYNEILDVLKTTYLCPAETLFGTDHIVLDILDFSTSNNTLDLYVRPNVSGGLISESEIRLANIVPEYKEDNIRVVNGNVYSGPAIINFSSDETLENYKNNPIPVTYYDTQRVTFSNFNLRNYIMAGNTK